MSGTFWAALIIAIFAGASAGIEYGPPLYFSLMVIVLSAKMIAEKLKK